jgi:nanoRNase/pAp phosphatase (c-di-AMP/oligoRNAs hydrolase)
MKQYNTEPIKKSLETAKNILILLPQNPTVDSVAAGLSLYLSFSNTQKNTSIGCSTEMTVEFNRLFSVDKIKSNIGNQNLIITFNYSQDQIEKIAHDQTQDQQLFLTIEPKVGAQPINPDQVEYSYSGSTADLIFVIGARALEDLGSLYQREKDLFKSDKKTIVNLSHIDKNTQFGSVNLYDPTAAGESEITLSLINSLNLTITPDIATNLLAGIESATSNLSTANSADTYETIAKLIRLGAKRNHLSQYPEQPAQLPQFPGSQTPPFTPQAPRTTLPSFTKPLNPTTPPPAQLPQFPGSQTPPFTSQAPRTTLPSFTKPLNPTTPQPDWLKPKVLTSSKPKI